MLLKKELADKLLTLGRKIQMWRLGWVLLLFLLFQCAHGQGLVANGGRIRVKRISDPVDFFNVVKARSADVIFILKDMNIRNYFGWVLPSSSADVIQLKGTLEISADPQLKRRPIIDLDGNPIERMISGIVEFNSRRLHYTNMRFPDYFGPGSVRPHMTLNDCIVDLKVETQEGGLAGFWKSLSPSVESLEEGEWDMIHDSDCQEKFGVSCETGAIYVTNSSVTIAGGQYEQEQSKWLVHNTLFKLSEISTERASDSKIFLMAVSMQNSIIYIPHDFQMNKIVCGKSPFQMDTIIQDPGRAHPPSLVVDFRRTYECMEVLGAHTLRISDLIIRNLVFFDWWPDVFPFATGNHSTIVLENVIVELDIDNTYDPVRLDDMVGKMRGQVRVPGLGDGIQKLSRWHPEQCLEYQQQSQKCREKGRCSPEAKCPLGGIFVKDASFTLNQEHRIDRAGIKYHILHSLFTVVTYAPQPDPLPPPQDISSQKQPSSGVDNSVNILMAITVVGTVVLVLMCCILSIFWHKRQSAMTKETDESKTSNKPESVSDENGVSSKAEISLKEISLLLGHTTPQNRMETREDREYQIAANKLLGSVNLGQLIGMGSFGRVYKGTWNGATCAVKVISHARSGSAEVFACREAGISTDLHHPNVVQTFIQTTRSFDGSGSLSEASVPHGWSESVTPKSAQSSAGSEEAKERGYVEIGKITQRHKKPIGSSGNHSQTLSQRDSANDENWDCMSAVSMAMETWLVQEWCDMGSLDRAVEKGVFMLDDTRVDMLRVVDTCIDICRGMMYLKNRNIIHGDLKSSNVLMTGSLHEPKGFTAKVADFGLSRQLAMDASHIKTRTTGTVTHMPPELFNEERLTNASDVYSFGILMWELVSGEAPLLGVPHFVVMKKILLDNWRPTFQDENPKSYRILAEQCWDCAASSRPSFELVMKALLEMRVEFAGNDSGRPT